jgi:hypothetical protein
MTIEPKKMTYDEFCEEELAVQLGLATELRHCYMYLPDVNDRVIRPESGPLRGVSHHTTSPGFDPYDVVHMIPCGHALI